MRLFLTAMLCAAFAAVGAAEEAELEIRVYDVSELLLTVRDYESQQALPKTNLEQSPRRRYPVADMMMESGSMGYGGGMTGGGMGMGMGMSGMGGMPGMDMGMEAGGMGMPARKSPATAKRNAGGLVESLKSALAEPEKKVEQGAIAAYGNLLIIRETPENHARIAAALKSAAAQAARKTLDIRVYWLLSDEPVVDYKTGRPAPRRFGSDLETGFVAVTQTQCMDGQTVLVSSGDLTPVLTKLTPTVSAKVSTFSTSVTRTQLGVTMQASAKLERKNCRLTVKGVLADSSADAQAEQNLRTLDAEGTAWSIPAVEFDVDLTVALGEATTIYRGGLPGRSGSLVVVAEVVER